MSRGLVALSGELLLQTREVLEALQEGSVADEVDRLVERQRESFSNFSRQCDVDVPLDVSTRANVDEVVKLEEEIVTSLRRQCQGLVELNRTLTGRKNQVRAFYSRNEEPPRFVTRHV